MNDNLISIYSNSSFQDIFHDIVLIPSKIPLCTDILLYLFNINYMTYHDILGQELDGYQSIFMGIYIWCLDSHVMGRMTITITMNPT